MKKILILAYAISPYKGSEFSVAWNYVENMSKNNELFVLFGTSGNHLGDTEELEEYAKLNINNNVHFIPIKPTRLAKSLNVFNKRNIFVYSFYLAFYFWHKQVYKVAKKMLEKEHFDLVHYVSPIGYREPGFLWKLNIPYLWGPVGGTHNVPNTLFSALSINGKLKLGLRKIINYFQFNYNMSLDKALEKVDVLIAATTQAQKKMQKKSTNTVYYLPENAITNLPSDVNKNYIDGRHNDKLEIVWVGRIDDGKALIILLKALVLVKRKSNININVVGDGRRKNAMISFVEKNKIENYITWHGAVERSRVFEIFENSDIHIITSLSEANTTVIWEAMSFGIPTISLDHCGMHDVICDKCGIKIPIGSYQQVVRELAIQIERLSDDKKIIKQLSNGVVECAKKYTWDKKRVDFFEKMYDIAIKNHYEKNK